MKMKGLIKKEEVVVIKGLGTGGLKRN